MSFWSKWKIPTHRRILLILLTPPGLVGASMFGYFEMGWQCMKRDSELDEQRLEERMSALKTRLERYDQKSRNVK
jgi:hypothetical protein